MITEKIDVNGENTHSLYRFLKGEYDAEESVFSGDIGWNFEYFFVNSQGKVVNRWPTGTDMTSSNVITFLQENLEPIRQEL